MANNPQSGPSNRQGSDQSTFGTRLVERAKQGVADYLQDTNIGRALRSVNLLSGAEQPEGGFTEGSWYSGSDTDWRVRLSVPSNMSDSFLLKPLKETGNSLVFPYTPSVFVTHTANYDAVQPTHSNYPFRVYQNSQVDSINVTGSFTVENSREGLYWIAMQHYLRSVTKMAYGKSANAGAPPPVVKFNGYGDYVFNNVPVVVQTYNFTMMPDVDYIKVDVGPNGTWVPVQSELAVTLLPAYSRDVVNKFSLDSFVSGGYLFGNDDGYL
jgi:hypothetical protein